MRILFDYRPALRRRTGVGEYAHETARALVASAPAGEHLTLFNGEGGQVRSVGHGAQM